MKKYFLLMFFFTSLAATSLAQTRRCPEYDQILRNLQQVYSNNLLDSALLQVRFLRACTPNDEVLADEWTQKIFDKIKQQNTEAKAAQNRAEASEKKANAALNRAKRLISYFNFGNEDAGWAYQNGRFAVVDREGNRLTDYIYSTPDTFANGIALTNVNGQFVFLNYKGEEITERYDFVAQQSNDIYFAGSGKIGYNNEFRKKNYICLCQVAFAKPTKDKRVALNVYPYFIKLKENVFFAITKDGLWVRLNERGCQTSISPYKEISPYYSYRSYESTIIAVKVDSLWGFIDSLEQWVIPPQFKSIPSYTYIDSDASPESMKKIIDSLISLVIPPKVENAYTSNDNYMIPAQKDSLWGYVDKSGSWRIQPQYSQVGPFRNGRAKVGFINKEGEPWNNEKYGLIDTTGKIVIPIKYEYIYLILNNGLAWVSDDRYLLLVDSSGRKFDSLSNQGSWYLFSKDESGLKLMVGGEERDSTNLIYSDGRVRRWPPNGGIKRFSSKYHDTEFAINIDKIWHYANFTRIYDHEIHFWDDVYFEKNGLTRVRKDTLWGLLDSTGQLIVEPQFKHLLNFEDGLARIQNAKDTLWGVIDTTGQIIVEPKFEEIDIGSWGNSITFRKGKLWGYINIGERIYIEPQFSKIYIENDEGALAIIYKGALMGRIDTAGHIVMDKVGTGPTPGEVGDRTYDPPIGIVDYVPQRAPFGYNLTMFHEGDLWGIRDSAGQIKLKPQFKSISYFYHGLAKVQRDSLLGYINLAGSIVLEPQFNKTFAFEHGLAPVRKDSLWGYIDTLGKIIVEPQFNQTYAFTCGLAPVQKGKLCGYIDTIGQLIIPIQFELAYNFKNNIAWVKKNGLWGVLNTMGKFLIEPQFYLTNEFEYGLVKVKKGDKWGLVDNTGKVVLPIQFDRIDTFENGFAKVEQSEKIGLIDLHFNLVLPCDYSDLRRVSVNDYMTEFNGRYGLFNSKYGIHIPAEYETFGFAGEEFGWVRAKKNGKWGWIDQHGTVKIPFRYDASMPFKNGKAWVLQEPNEDFFEINREGKMIRQ